MSDNSMRNNPDNKDSAATMVYLQLSDRLQQRGIVENIGLDTKANIIKVNLNHGSKRTIVSTIFPIWAKTIHDFEKQAKRKNLSGDEITDITDCLDDNHETILAAVVDNKIKSIYNNDNNQSNQEHEIADEIKQTRSNNSNITADEWQNRLKEKYTHLHDTVDKNLPNLWPALEFELSIQKILNIKDCTLPFAGIILGPPSSLKTQVIEILRNWPHTFYTDNFSAKSFVSHTTSVAREQLAQIDLLPKIKNKCFLTPELAPTFAAKDDDLIQILGIMTRILDGNGYESDSGAQGHRGYNGEMMFTWVGATVDIPHKVHKYLGTLGPKLYFFRPPIVQKKTEDDYLEEMKNDDFNKKIVEIREALLDLLKWFEIGPGMVINNENGSGKMPWNFEKDDKSAQKYIIRLANLLTHLRGVAPTWNTYGTQGSDYAYTLPTIEEPDRAIRQLTNLARGHALSMGRNFVTLEDIPLIIGVVMSTASKERVTVFDLLLAKNGVLTTSDISLSLNMSAPTSRKTMLELWVLKLVDKDNIDNINSVQRISLRPEFKWFISNEFKRLRESGMKGIQACISTEEEKENIPPSSQDFLIPDSSSLSNKEAAFWNIYDKLGEEQKTDSNHMEIDKNTVSGQELEQRLVSSGTFYTSDAHMMIVDMVSKGELKEVTFDTYVRGSSRNEGDHKQC